MVETVAAQQVVTVNHNCTVHRVLKSDDSSELAKTY